MVNGNCNKLQYMHTMGCVYVSFKILMNKCDIKRCHFSTYVYLLLSNLLKRSEKFTLIFNTIHPGKSPCGLNIKTGLLNK